MDIFRWTFDPWAGVRQLRDEMEDVFRRLNRVAGVRRAAPPVNVFQDGEGVTVVAEVPGVKASDLNIEFEGDSLRLTLKRARPEGIDNDRYHRRERSAGEYVRELRLPAGLDSEKIEADLADGILTIRLPKAEAAKARKIAVKAN
jgi:HSP20 family protein